MKFVIFFSLFVFALSTQRFLQPVQNQTNTTIPTVPTGPTTVNQLTSTLKDLIPNLQSQMQNNPAYTSQVVQQIVSTGMSSFEESGSIQQSNGVYNQYIKFFLSALKNQISLPAQYGPKFDTYIQQVLKESNGTWVEFSVVFSLPKTEQMKFVCIFAKNDPDNMSSDWIVANIQDTFKLVSTTIMEAKSCQMETLPIGLSIQKCTTSVSSSEQPATQQEIECVIDFLEIAAYKRIIAQQNDEIIA